MPVSASGLWTRNCARARCQHPDEDALIERWASGVAGAVRGWRWAQGARFLVPSAVPNGEELSQRVKRANFEQRGGASLHRDRHTCVGRAAHSKMRTRHERDEPRLRQRLDRPRRRRARSLTSSSRPEFAARTTHLMSQSALERLVSWATAHGAALHPHLAIGHSPTSGHGLAALQPYRRVVSGAFFRYISSHGSRSSGATHARALTCHRRSRRAPA